MCFPEFYEPWQQITEPEEGVVGTLIYRQTVRSPGHNLGRMIASEVRNGLVSMSP